ncbi:MAG: aminopeptidase P family protein [Prevotellaceae bacterium]|jgi:Xaa-Pro aminopeptidase|nr:aminopeptidase P family protein [Prevotellaceae bacterium]
MNKVKERLEALRAEMKKNGVSAYVIPGTDPHASEYIADYWKERVWISGFNGSAGVVAITMDKAGLWTDSRYFLQGAEQLHGTGIELMKQGLPQTPEIVSWLASELKAGEKVAVNPQMFSLDTYTTMKTKLDMSRIDLVSIDLIQNIWKDRPALPKKPFFVFDIKYSGKSTIEKLTILRDEMKKNHADVFVMSALDDIAWLFNIRGNDVSFNPVVIAYALVDMQKATLFIDPDKVGEENKKYLDSQNVSYEPYEDIYKALAQIGEEKSVLVDGAKLNRSLFETIPMVCPIRNTMSPVFKLKSIKNEVEIEGIRRAMIKDGVALTRFFRWLEENVKTGKVTEITIEEKLRSFRSEEENFVGESFNTIAGYAAHGAIVHYSATSESNVTLKQENIVLIDSGAQYLDGTTDITRTFPLGTPTIAQKTDYTLVLKGHIAIDQAIFPAGTRGSQIDILARKPMWNRRLNYGHGTGHGVGHFLNVHEGPQSIRMDENSTTLQPGMILSNEPGLYRAEKYGIRIENLVLVVEDKVTEFGQFLKFETLTLFPINQDLIDAEMLSDEEIKWLNSYHSRVYDTLSPGLELEEREWLAAECRPIKK